MGLIPTLLIIFLGILLVALEIVVLPGGIAGILGGCIAAVGIGLTFHYHGFTTGTIVLLSSLAICVLLVILMMKSRTWKRFTLNQNIDGVVNTHSDTQLIGQIGTTLSRLVPAGNALLDGKITEVHSESGFIPEGQQVKVVAVEGYKVLVVPAFPTDTQPSS
ncbi:MAG: NfeD family protein [Bacteroidales bacterium]|nr:NfeD family protein [Bacteroidales bacterium]